MDSSKKVFTGKSGKLTIGERGVTIERSYAQASQNKTGLKTELNFNDIESMHHRYAADKPGYIELRAKAGSTTPGSGLNRRHRIHFDAATAHRFRRAQRQIARKLAENSFVTTNQSSEMPETAQAPALETYPVSRIAQMSNPAWSASKNNQPAEAPAEIAAPAPLPSLLEEDSPAAGLPFRQSSNRVNL